MLIHKSGSAKPTITCKQTFFFVHFCQRRVISDLHFTDSEVDPTTVLSTILFKESQSDAQVLNGWEFRDSTATGKVMSLDKQVNEVKASGDVVLHLGKVAGQ